MEPRPRRIYITDPDRRRLLSLLPARGPLGGGPAGALRAGLETAAVVASEQLPPGVVTLGRGFRLRDLETEEEAEYTLVLPDLADLARGHISVLAPIGASLLGAQERETITFSTPLSTRRLRIEAVVCGPGEAGAR